MRPPLEVEYDPQLIATRSYEMGYSDGYDAATQIARITFEEYMADPDNFTLDDLMLALSRGKLRAYEFTGRPPVIKKDILDKMVGKNETVH